MAITTEIRSDEYRIASNLAAFIPVGEFGPLPCGCCIVSTEIDPVGPRLVFLMMRRDAAKHKEHTLLDFEELYAA